MRIQKRYEPGDDTRVTISSWYFAHVNIEKWLRCGLPFMSSGNLSKNKIVAKYQQQHCLLLHVVKSLNFVCDVFR